jgi:hypothetical protein
VPAHAGDEAAGAKVQIRGEGHAGEGVSNPRSARECRNQRRAKRDRQPKGARRGAKRIKGE